MSFVEYNREQHRDTCPWTLSITTDWACQALDSRNASMQDNVEDAERAPGQERQSPDAEGSALEGRTVNWSHRLLAGAMLLGIGLLSIIESVARLILAAVVLPVFFITIVIWIKPAFEAVGEVYFGLAGGAVVSFENFLNCMVGSVKSLSSKEVKYNDLIPCIAGFNEAYHNATCCEGEPEAHVEWDTRSSFRSEDVVIEAHGQ